MTPISVGTLDLTKTYEAKERQGLFKATDTEVEALKNVSLEINAGEIFGLFSMWLFRHVESNLRRNDGIGKF
jgi:hypothetical protein